jgi:hypothetical protein
MEDHVLDLVIGEGPSARSIRIDLAPFTLVAATTRAGMLATPLRDRFGIPIRLEFYTRPSSSTCCWARPARWARRCRGRGADEIAGRARGTPRVAGRLLRRVRDFATADGAAVIDKAAGLALARLEVDEAGLDSLDRRYLRALIEHYAGGPAGVETLAYAIAEARDAVEDVIEPYPDAAGLHPAHPARPGGLRQGLSAPGPERARRAGETGAGRTIRGLEAGDLWRRGGDDDELEFGKGYDRQHHQGDERRHHDRLQGVIAH